MNHEMKTGIRGMTQETRETSAGGQKGLNASDTRYASSQTWFVRNGLTCRGPGTRLLDPREDSQGSDPFTGAA